MEKTRQVISDTEILSVFSPPPSGWNVSCYRVNWDPDDDDNTLQPIGDIATAILDPFEYISSMEYDALNRARSVMYPEDVDGERKILLPTYNKGGALTQVDLKDNISASAINYVDRIAYNAKGQQLLVAYGNGIMTRFLYRSDNFRLLRLKSKKYTKSGLTYTPNSGVKQNYSYIYDLSGNIINISDTTANCGYGATPNALSRDFIYDALYRLLSATGRETAATGTTPWTDLYRPENESLARGYTQQYEYDKLGNIQELQHIATSGNFTRTFGYDSPFNTNKLNSITIGSNTYNFTHDVNGNMLSEGDIARHLEYDCADRLRCFFVQTGTAEPSKYTHYLYDGGGNRVKKITRTQGGGYTATTYIDGAFEYTKESSGFDGIPNLAVGTWTIGVYSGGGEQNILNIMGGASRRIGSDLGDSTPAIKYNLSDHLGSSCVQLDTNGTTVSLEEYYPFGETSFGSYYKKRYRFCGKEKDEESGLYYYGMRYYSAWTCRFINVDPLAGKYPFYTPYQYTGNNPITFTDLDGQETTSNPTTGVPTNGQQGDNSTTATSGGTYHGGGENNHGVHTVIEGNTLWHLSKRYGVSVEEIQKANNLDPSNTTIKVGQQLTIPGQKAATPTPQVFSAVKLNINNPSESTAAKTNPYYQNLNIKKPDSHQTFLNPTTPKSQATLDYLQNKADKLDILSTVDKIPFGGSAFAAGGYHGYGMYDEMWSSLSTTAIEIGTLRLGSTFKLTTFAATKTSTKLLPEAYSRFSRFEYHFGKHAGEWGAVTKDAYYKRSLSLLDGPVGGNIQGFTNPSGYTFRMNMRTAEFGMMRPNGVVESFYRRLSDPNKYWTQQTLKYINR